MTDMTQSKSSQFRSKSQPSAVTTVTTDDDRDDGWTTDDYRDAQHFMDNMNRTDEWTFPAEDAEEEEEEAPRPTFLGGASLPRPPPHS